MEKKDYGYFNYLGKRCIKQIFKQYLYHLEDLLENGAISEDNFEKARERILDVGNDQVRFFEDQARSYYELNE